MGRATGCTRRQNSVRHEQFARMLLEALLVTVSLLLEPNHTNSKDVENEEDNGDQSRGRKILELLKSSKKDSTTGAVGIQITDLRVPPIVKNNSGSAAVLDCEYTLKQDELAAEAYSGLVVKWYFNNSPSPVYQWIPGQKPQDLGILKGKLDLSHRASGHQATMHRALYIPNPTTDLSGDYKCLVSTFSDEDFMTKKMVVFAAEKNLEFTASKPGPEAVNLTCRARSVYPEPKMALYKDPDRTKLEDVRVETVSRRGSYDIVAQIVIQDSELDEESATRFSCELRIPEVNYVSTKKLIYFPGLFDNPTSDRGDAISGDSRFWMSLMTSLVAAYSVWCC